MSRNNIYMLINHMRAQQKHLAEDANRFMKRLPRMTEDGRLQMVETRLYVGLNDAQTRLQRFPTEWYKALLKEICRDVHIPFSVAVEEGGYFHEDGEYTEEQTLVLTLIDAQRDEVFKIANKVLTLFHQESVLITQDDVKGCYIVENSEELRNVTAKPEAEQQ